LEKLGETKTVKDLRETLRAIDMDFNKRMACIEYLLFKFNRPIEDFVRRPQGENTAEIKEAQRQLEEAQASLESANKAVEESEKAAQHAADEVRNAKLRADESKQRTSEATAAEDELKAALNELHAQEDAYNRKTAELQKKSEDANLGVVQRNKAKNELAQHQSEDPLPLRKAKLTTEAATKKAEKARKLAEEAQRRAEDAHAAAEQAKHEAEERAEIAKQKAVEMEEKFTAAEKYLEEVRSRPGGGQGALWWIERELHEARKYMPKKRL